ncbi:MAG TPA: toll/interleukin-1 receptor domain-containing protein [Blastocatellia bacterium]|nr:toll/interleukin-1 receptor domain-containing protein [Blastocatellia bacterium]
MVEIEKTSSVFISHIGEEAEVAKRIKELINAAFDRHVSVLVSSDYESIASGEDWNSRIVSSIRSSKVVIVLVSKESVSRPWINFEAGAGAGSLSRVIPLVIRGFDVGNLQPPLQPFHARDIHDPEGVEALLRDIGDELGKEPDGVDVTGFIEDIRRVESGLPCKGLVLRPFTKLGPERNLYIMYFELSNTGTFDIELIVIEACIPTQVLFPEPRPREPKHVIETTEKPIDGVEYTCVQWKVFDGEVGSYYERLPRWITVTMSPYAFKRPAFVIRSPLKETELAMVLRFRVHARDFKSQWHEVPLTDLLEEKT